MHFKFLVPNLYEMTPQLLHYIILIHFGNNQWVLKLSVSKYHSWEEVYPSCQKSNNVISTLF